MKVREEHPLIDIIKDAGYKVKEVAECAGHNNLPSFYRTLRRISNGVASINTTAKVAKCIGVPVWYLVFLLRPEFDDALLRKAEEVKLEVLKRVAKKSRYLLWGFVEEMQKRGSISPGIQEFLDEELGGRE